MRSRRDRDVLPNLRTLFLAGSGVGLTDLQLLECFATRDGEAAELAFAVLVERHGPMVLRTCRAVLRDEHDARDAFQATFLILARRGGSLWVRDSIGPWLHRVARRAAIRARRDAGRRRVIERNAVLAANRSPSEAGDGEVAAIVHEEVDRLPDRYRVPVVLCDLDGRTHEEAARHLGCPVGTVKSRLVRGRERLRDRLTRRGLAPGWRSRSPSAPPCRPGWRIAPPGSPSGPRRPGLVRSPPRSAGSSVMRCGRCSWPSWGALLIKRRRPHDRVGLVLFGAGRPARQAPGEKSHPRRRPAAVRRRPPGGAGPEYAWRRADRYEPPDFSRYFPDDPEGGRALDRLWEDRRPGQAARRGCPADRPSRAPPHDRGSGRGPRLGRPAVHLGASPQDPAAIEMLYHATDFRGPMTGYGESPSIYYGLMRVEPKTLAILHALVDWCMHVENTMDWYWAGWIGRKHRAELLAYLKPYLASGDEATRKRAAVVRSTSARRPIGTRRTRPGPRRSSGRSPDTGCPKC